MDGTRRSLLVSLGGSVTVGLAGCASVSDRSTSESDTTTTYLPPKDWGADPAELPFPTHGMALPAATLPAPLRNESVSIPEDFAGRDLLLTFIYTHCMTMCPRLTAILENIQDHALENGYGDTVAFAEISFDPARDDAERFRQWADQHHVALDAGNWYFLLPESEQRAREVVQGKYGVDFVKTTPENMDAYMFTHTGLILLANRDGYVERAYLLYTGGEGDLRWQDVRDDLTTLREREV